jgi:YidC/Oxa1 family membrane protein insertase
VGAKQFAKVLLSVLKLFQGVLGNWGVAIILLTLLVRALLMPINLRQAKAMRVYQDKMAKLKPEMDRIKEKHKGDQQKLNQAMLKLQREHKIFPPLMGCLPIFLTMPVLFGLFTMLRASFELRQQPFLLWIQDLSQPDRLFHIGDLSQVPLLPDFSYFNLLPVLMTTLWVLNMLRTPLPTDPQARTQFKMMRVMMPLMGVMLYNYASGLALYMTVSAVWTLVEQSILKKRLGAVGMPTM